MADAVATTLEDHAGESQLVREVIWWREGRVRDRPTPQIWLFVLRECPDVVLECDYRDSTHVIGAMEGPGGVVRYAHHADTANAAFDEVCDRKDAAAIIRGARSLSLAPTDESVLPSLEPAEVA